MKKFFKRCYIVFSFVFLLYLLLPSLTFPQPPLGALQSEEPGDNESPLRRAYFTDLGREEVMHYYQAEIAKSSLFSVPLPTYRLNYPPEEAKTIIRDQTRSTFLEEIVHPFRESVYINGFEPKSAKDTINIAGITWRQKIIVKLVPSNMVVRVVVAVFSLITVGLLYQEWTEILLRLKKIL